MSYLTRGLARLLLVALERCTIADRCHALPSLRCWLDSWRGIGAVDRGMAHQGCDLLLTRYDEHGWRATFYTTGMEHLPTSATGTAWERTSWRATQRVACFFVIAREAISRMEESFDYPFDSQEPIP